MASHCMLATFTQVLSHALEQQNESTAHTHDSMVESSLQPASVEAWQHAAPRQASVSNCTLMW